MAGQQPQGYPPQPNGQGQPQGQQQPYPQQGGPQQGYDPNAPYGYDRVGRPYSEKQKLVAGLLQILLGGFAVGRFYIGDTKTAIWQLVATWLTCGLGGIWPLIDGIMMLTTDEICDSEGRPLRP